MAKAAVEMAVLDAELRAVDRSFADFLGVTRTTRAEWRERRHPRLDRRAAGGGRGLPRRRVRPHQAEDRTGLGPRAGGRRAAADRRRRAAAGRRQHRLPPRRHRPPVPARRVRPAAHRAAARRGRPARPRPARRGRDHPRLPRRVDHVGDGRRATRSSSGRARSSTSSPVGSVATSRPGDPRSLPGSAACPVWCGGMLETGIGRAANVALAALDGFTVTGDISAARRFWRATSSANRSTSSTGTSPSRPEPGSASRSTSSSSTRSTRTVTPTRPRLASTSHAAPVPVRRVDGRGQRDPRAPRR